MHKDMLPPELLLLAQIYTKSFVGWGFAQGPTGELTALPRPLAGLGGGAPGKGKEGGEGKRREGRGGEGKGGSPPGMPKSRVGKPNRSRRNATIVYSFTAFEQMQHKTMN